METTMIPKAKRDDFIGVYKDKACSELPGNEEIGKMRSRQLLISFRNSVSTDDNFEIHRCH